MGPDRQLPTKIVFCQCANAEVLPADARERARQEAANTVADCEIVDDLCELVAQRDPRLVEWAQTPGLHIIACHPRAIRWLFHAAGADLPADNVTFQDLRDGAHRLELEPIPDPHAPSVDGKWQPWFPVIDFERCTDCMQCLSFCPFGVYEMDAGKLVVAHPRQCKNNCPACARICPESAIIFPKFPHGPVSGEPVTATTATATPAAAEESLNELLAKRRRRAEQFRQARLGTGPST